MTQRGNPFIAIVGTGMGALGAASGARAEGLTPTLFDKALHVGGHTTSHAHDGFIFDEGPHVSFTSNARIRAMLLANVGQEFESIVPTLDNYWQGRRIKHPVITNLRGLPDDLVVKIIEDYVTAKANPPVAIHNYEEWLVASYGRTYAAAFPMKYGCKYHTTEASNMSTEWVGPRLYQASLEEVLRGALSTAMLDVHYVQEYRYPKQGGFQAFLNPFYHDTDIRLDHELVRVKPRSREAVFSNGVVARYDHLISSVPLTDLVPMVEGAPPDVLEAASKLACSTVVLVNLGVRREDVSASSWSYFYDEDLPFSRVSFPRNMSTHTVPAGMSSIQAEIYFSRKYKPLTVPADSLIAPTIAALRKCNILREDDDIVFQQTQVVDYANIIFDLDRAAALRVVHGFLDDVGIGYCGRYGDWGYQWTDEAFVSGENAIQRALTGHS